MKVNKIMDRHASSAPVIPAKRLVVEDEAVQPEASATSNVDAVIFPASDRFKHMLSLISRDNKELYNRIIGME